MNRAISANKPRPKISIITYEPRVTFQNFCGKSPDLTAAQWSIGNGQCRNNQSLHYHVNGTGRDTYIHLNNGGFNSVYHEPIKYAKPGTFKQKPSMHEVKAPPHPVIHPKTSFYRSDGTGRDRYIE